jgi:hypothetical protein
VLLGRLQRLEPSPRRLHPAARLVPAHHQPDRDLERRHHLAQVELLQLRAHAGVGVGEAADRTEALHDAELGPRLRKNVFFRRGSDGSEAWADTYVFAMLAEEADERLGGRWA